MSGIKIINDGTVTRQTIPNDPENPSNYNISSGYDFPPDEEFYLPDCGIFEADEAITLLFRDKIGFDTKEIWSQNEMIKIDKPQVIFAGGERWALSKKKIPPMDRTKQLLLPAINIRRTDISFAIDEQKRGISSKSKNLIIKRQLSNDFDRDYQNIINKLGLRNLSGLPTTTNDVVAIVEESAKEGTKDVVIQEGGLLQPILGNNVYEILSIPLPKFFISKYEVTFWTTEIDHMNYMMETFYTSALAQEDAFKLVTPAGYWFMGGMEPQNQNASNFEEYKEDKRIVRYKIEMRVKGFILPTQRGKNANPVRKWVFAPRINFEISQTPKMPIDKETLSKRNDGVDIPSIPANSDASFPLFSLSSNVEQDSNTKQVEQTSEKTIYETSITNKKTKKQTTLYVTEKARYDRSGETITRFSSRQAMEDIKQAAYRERLERQKKGK